MDTNLDCLTFQNISKMDLNQDFAQKYLEYLLTLIHLNKPVDFIQAALVMQTLSNIFAKKVDHLQEQILAFTIVFRKLELGNRQDNEDEENGGAGESQNRERAKALKKRIDKEAMLNSFENVCVINNIRKSYVKKWSANNMKKIDLYPIRNRINECPKIKTKENYACQVYDSKEDLLGKKGEFSVNGIICNDIIPKDDFCIPCEHIQTTEFEDTLMPVDAHPSEPLRSDSPVINDCDMLPPPSPIAPDNEHEISYQNVVQEFLNHSNLNGDNSTSSHAYFEKMNNVKEVLVDVAGMCDILWAPVSDDNVLMDRELKKRDVKMQTPDFNKEQKERKRTFPPYPTEYVLSDLLLAVYKLKSNVVLHRHFANGIRAEKEQAEKLIAKDRRKGGRRNAYNTNPTDFKGFNDYGDNDNAEDRVFEHENDIAPIDDELPFASPTHDGGSGSGQDYLPGALQHINDYQQNLLQSHNHDDTINEIAEKVSSWHDSMRPVLEREEQRVCFDIHEYGSRILQKFPPGNSKTTLSFADAVKDQSREEIPRFFLSSLLLANSYNVEISKDNDAELSVNDMMLTLLSRVRQHEVLDEGMRKEYS